MTRIKLPYKDERDLMADVLKRMKGAITQEDSMTNEAKNKIIAEALGICLHEWKETQLSPYSLPIRYECEKCRGIGFGTLPVNHDFSTPEGFFVIMERGPGRKWWESFLNSGPGLATFEVDGETIRDYLIESYYLNPPRMSDTLATWLKEHEGEWREK